MSPVFSSELLFALLYGTTYQGGAYNYGTVFKITALGQFTVLYSFPGGAAGANPYADLNLDQQGNIYGTTYSGGSHNLELFSSLMRAEMKPHSITSGKKARAYIPRA